MIRVRVAGLVGLVGLLGLGHAQVARAAGCAPLDEIELQRQLLDLRAALDLDQPTTHAALVDQVADRVPCLTFAPDPRLWASFLVHFALREFDAGRDWTIALATAVHLHPLVDRAVGPGHPLASWTPSRLPQAVGGLPPPSGFSLYVDGDAALAFPYDGNVHLVQLFDGRFWTSALLGDPELPPGWVTGDIEPPPHVAAWVSVLAGLGGARAAQRPDPVGVDWLERPPQLGLDTSVAAELRTALRTPIGFAFGGAARGATVPAASSLEAHGGIAVGAHGSHVVVGVGAASCGVATAGGAVERLWLPFPYVAGGVRLGRLSARATAGVAPAVQLGGIELAAEPPASGRWRVRVGGALTARRLRLVQPDTGFRVSADVLTLSGTVGASWSTER